MSRAEQSRAEQSTVANCLIVYTFFLIHRMVDELTLVLLKYEGGLGSVFYVPCLGIAQRWCDGKEELWLSIQNMCYQY